MGGFANEDLWKDFVINEGHEHVEDRLILSSPSDRVWVCGDGEGAISGGGGVWIWWAVGVVNKTVEVMPLEVGYDLSTPHKNVSFVELGDGLGEIEDEWCWVVLLHGGWVCGGRG